MNYKIDINDIIESNLNFNITCSNSFKFDNTNRLEKKDTDIVYYSNYYFEGLITNYSKHLESVNTSLVYGRIIDNTFLVYVEFGNNIINPNIYVIGKSNYEWFGAKYECNLKYGYNEIIDSKQVFVKHTFTSDDELKNEYEYIKYIEECMNSQLKNKKVEEVYNYFKTNFDKEAIKVLELFRNQLNDRFIETVDSMETSINNPNYEDVDSSYMYLLSGYENWLPLRNSFNYLLDLDDLKRKIKRY